VDKQGRRRDYESAYLRRTFRAEGRVKNETVANLSVLPRHVIDWIDAGLKGKQLIPAEATVTIERSLPHGHLASVYAQAKVLGLPGLLGPACRERDLAFALIISRVVRPGSKLSTLTWWADTTLGVDLDVAGACTDEIYAAMDWLVAGQDRIEAELARRHLAPKANPSRMALFDLSSSWVEGSQCPLAARGYSRDGKKGKAQIEYGLLTDPAGRPVAVRVFPGNTADPTAFVQVVEVVRTKFGLTQMVMVGDRGMITSARIEALKDLGGLGWLTALRAPAIAALAADDGPLQLSLFDQTNLAEISRPDYPGERLIACHNPALAADRARTRTELLAATEAALAPLIARVQASRLRGTEAIGVAAGKLINKYKVGKHFHLEITDTTLTITRNQDTIAAEAALDGIYVLRTSVPAHTLEASGVISAYKDLSHLERDFRIIKADDLDLRPIYHRLEDRVRAHVLICMLACYLVWHLRKAWAPLTFTDEHPPAHTNPVAAAQRSEGAQAKASYQRDAFGHPYRSFRGLLDHLATLTRNQLRYTGTDTTVAMLAEPTSDQREAFNLIGVPIPLTLQ
jgi:Transposase DDE domain